MTPRRRASSSTSTTSSERASGAAGAILAAVLLAGCTTTSRPSLPRPALPLPASFAQRYELPGAVTADYLVPLGPETSRIYRGRLRCGPEQPEFHLMLPEKTPAPVLLCLPILAGGKELMWLIGDYMSRRGYAVLWSQRVKSAMKPDQTPDAVEVLFRRTIRHNRALLAWATEQEWAATDRAGIIGLSTGGILGGTLLALEPSLRGGVLMLAGGDLPDLLSHSSEARIVKWCQHRRTVDGLDEAGLIAAMRRSLVSDPLRTAAYVPTDKVMMVIAGLDTVIPHRNRELLWEGLGRPDRLDLNVFSHYSAILGIYSALGAAREFLEQRFGEMP